MFPDNQDSIDCHFFSAAAESLGDRGINSEPEFLTATAAEVPFGFLIDVRRHDVEIGIMPFSRVRIAVQKSLGHVPGVRFVGPDRGDHGELLAGGRGRFRGRNQRSTDHSGSDGSEKVTTCQHGGSS